MTLSTDDDQLAELQKDIIEQGVENFTSAKKKQFWTVVGRIKRMEEPDDKLIEKAAWIRETLHEYRFGKPVPLNYFMLPLFISGILLVIGNLVYYNDNDMLFEAGIITYVAYILIFMIYFYILDFIFYNTYITFILLTILSATELTVLYYFVPGFLKWLVIYSAFGAVAALYPHGRWIAGKFTNIKLDGGIKDIYSFVTLKTNYKSYLSVSQNNRHWFFIIPGIGTATTATIIGIFEWIYFDNSFFIIAAFILAISEIYAYFFDVGKWGGELGHARRERLILKDISSKK